MRRRRSFAAAAAIAAALLLVGCTSAGLPSDGKSGATSTPEKPPEFIEGGTALENQPYFDHINQQTLAQNATASSHELVDALAAGGFDKAAMEVTFDRTNVDLEADYIIVSVKIHDECLIGQRSARGYTSQVMPPLGTGACLLGETQPIDW